MHITFRVPIEQIPNITDKMKLHVGKRVFNVKYVHTRIDTVFHASIKEDNATKAMVTKRALKRLLKVDAVWAQNNRRTVLNCIVRFFVTVISTVIQTCLCIARYVYVQVLGTWYLAMWSLALDHMRMLLTYCEMKWWHGFAMPPFFVVVFSTLIAIVLGGN